MLIVLIIVLIIAGLFAHMIVRSMRRSETWPKVTATVGGDAPQWWGPFRINSPRQSIPITFEVPSGERVTSSLELDEEQSAPLPGTTVEIIYDPTDPSRVEAYLGHDKGILQLLMVVLTVAFVLAAALTGAHK